MVRRVFIYGRFLTHLETLPKPPMTGPGIGQPIGFSAIGSPIVPEVSPIAIEILREPSVLELIGKVYVFTASRNYQPVTPLGVSNFNWYDSYQTALRNKEKYYFQGKDGDLWQVPWMRQESDESSAYIAVALKHD